ncbi:MAG: hypothetical protein IH956_08045, partial [Chloroflexi bacterium]|nr:hypothetical protein [Chloroflexota bacterium]
MVDERDEEGGKEDLFDKEDKFDAFTPEGEALGYITLEQARLVAMQTARDDPGNYGSRFSGVRMVYEVVEQDEGEDYYTITMTFRPEGDFRGTPGREQFVIEKEGRVAYRQVPSLPSRGRRFPILPVAIALVVVVAAVGVVGVLFASGGDDGGAADTPVAALAPTAAPVVPAAVPAPTSTATPVPVPTVVPTVAPQPIAPTAVPQPSPSRSPTVRPVSTPTEVPPPVSFLSQENLIYALRDLPPSFLQVDPTELGVSVESFGEVFTQLVAFASTDPLEFIFSAAGRMTNLQRIQLEIELADPDRYFEDFMAGFIGPGEQDLEIMDFGFLDVPPVGGSSVGIYVVFQSQGVVLRQDVLQFTRGNMAGLVFSMYPPGEFPTVTIDEAAFLVDDELRRFPQGIAVAPTRTPAPGAPTSTPPPTFPPASLTAFPTSVQVGQVITVAWSGAPGTSGDWIAMYQIGAVNEDYGDWDYTAGRTDGTMTFIAPSVPGTYEFRLLPNDEYQDIARSELILVLGATVQDDHGNSTADATLLGPGVTFGVIDPSDDVDYFEFFAQPGFIYTVEVQLDGHPDTVATLFDTFGEFILVSDDADGLSGGSRVHWLSETGGRYFVEVKSFNQDAETGEYAVVLSSVGPSEDDHGFSFDTATFVAPGFTPGFIINPADMDFFVFEAQPGAEYTIEVRLGTHPDTVLELYNAFGTMLDENDEGVGLNGGSRLVLTTSSTGQFYAVVRSFDNVEGSGSYVLALLVVGEATPTPTPFVPPTPTSTPVPVPPNLVPFAPEGWQAPLVVSQAPSSFVDLAPPGGGPFEAGKGLFIHWAVKNVSTTVIEQQFRVAISVDGEVVDTFLVLGLGDQEIERRLNVPVVLHTSGAHTVSMTVDFLSQVVESSEGDNTFSTIIFVVVPQPTPTPTAIPVFDDHGDSIATATFIGEGQMPGRINPASDVDFFRFSAQAGITYTIEVHLETHPDTVLTLYSSIGAFLDENDDATDLGTGSRITWTASVAGNLFVAVRSFDQSLETGSYNLVLKASLAPTPTPTPTPTPVPAGGVLVLSGGNAVADKAVLDALTARGLPATLGVETWQWNGTQHDLSGFDVVVLLNSYNWASGSMPNAGATALKDYVAGGAGVVTGEWLLFNVANGTHTGLAPMLPATYLSDGQEDHASYERVKSNP